MRPNSTKKLDKPAEVVAVADQKGGVGKSTTTNTIAYELAHKGYKVALIDFDPQSSQTNVFMSLDDLNFIGNHASNITRIFKDELVEPIIINNSNEERPVSLDFFPCNEELVDIFESSEITYDAKMNALPNFIKKIKANYDFIIIDCQPLFGVSNKSALLACDSLFVPVATRIVDENGIARFFKKISKAVVEYNTNINRIFVLPTMHQKINTDAKLVLGGISKLPRLISVLSGINKVPVHVFKEMPHRSLIATAAARGFFVRDYIECKYVDKSKYTEEYLSLADTISESVIKHAKES